MAGCIIHPVIMHILNAIVYRYCCLIIDIGGNMQYIMYNRTIYEHFKFPVFAGSRNGHMFIDSLIGKRNKFVLPTITESVNNLILRMFEHSHRYVKYWEKI